MTDLSRTRNPLYELEMETLEEGREWMRQRLEKKLQRLAEKEGRLSPPGPSGAEGRSLPDDPHPEHGR